MTLKQAYACLIVEHLERALEYVNAGNTERALEQVESTRAWLEKMQKEAV